MEGYHKSVLLEEAIDVLIPTRLRQDDLASAFGSTKSAFGPTQSAGTDAWYLDCTLGDGGHSIEIIKRGGKVVGIDVDPQALKRAQKRFKDVRIGEDRYKLVRGNFRDIENLIQSSLFAGVLFDLGVSSLQLESPGRGFSFNKEGPLDMRMDPSLNVMAMDLVNILTGKELYELFRSLGEEKYSWDLASALVRAREVEKGTGVKNTKDLADLVGQVYRRMGIQDSKVHPATRVFQALRIAVNDELGALKEGLEQVKEVVEKNGRIVVISFHSLEDRIVKNTFQEWQLAGVGEVLTKKPILPDDQEIAENPRSRSAKMRVFKKI